MKKQFKRWYEAVCEGGGCLNLKTPGGPLIREQLDNIVANFLRDDPRGKGLLLDEFERQVTYIRGLLISERVDRGGYGARDSTLDDWE